MRTLFVATLLPLLAHAADFTVGSATARAGQKATGYIEVPAGVDAAANIPVIVVNGAKPGPVLAMVAGSHGTEYASIVALQKLAQAADPALVDPRTYERPGRDAVAAEVTRLLKVIGAVA